MAQLTFFVPESARKTQADLLAALGTENEPAQWMIFMRTVTQLLPDVLSSGRTPTEVVKRSAIGQLGFTSWREMIEAPTADGGLSWNFSAWKAWRRAWSVVLTYPWLGQQPLTSSEVNTLAADVRRSGHPFPQSLEELAAFRELLRNDDEQRRVATLQGQTDRADAAEATVAELRTQLTAATARAQALAEQLALADARIEQLAMANARIEQLTAQIEQLTADLAAARKAKPQPQEQPKPAHLTRWQHLLAALTGRP